MSVHSIKIRVTEIKHQEYEKIFVLLEKKDTFNTLLSAVELGELVRKYLFIESTIHPHLHAAATLHTCIYEHTPNSKIKEIQKEPQILRKIR